MKSLTAYVIDGHDVRIRPAPVDRDWMNATDERFAYRCLPLNIANAHGWEILCTSAFSASWDGRKGKDAIRVRSRSGTIASAVSHFGDGILTFHVPCLFRTEAGMDLFVTGPINRPKDAISPLSGVIETDWSPYTFTMNWKFTRPFQKVYFDADEPFCHLFPVKRGGLESIEPDIRNLSDNPDLNREYDQWTKSRNTFNADLGDQDSRAAQDRWQKSYFRGEAPSGASGPGDHRSKLRLKPFDKQ
ncbi:hypothetical protein A6U87_07275 [Rhizobium sp. AC44/96]|uniref:DUF6065 family protein n=1 Tax=unclassified Rhizobium TaxID=2613769 RepID=UPI0008100D68|nr:MULTISPECIES: DUF6065 family protein [unclassified Rhizobium]MDM9623354.1 DUF6065 family protein [Rhizobium sp. S96]OCJ13084.1 hypothetical protein A6U87_07275 [Rhizobium sp. AC44/96]